jgi:hypothetical protein
MGMWTSLQEPDFLSFGYILQQCESKVPFLPIVGVVAYILYNKRQANERKAW